MKVSHLRKNVWTVQETMEFSKKMGALLKSGIPIIESLSIVSSQLHKRRRNQIEGLKVKIRSGVSLVEAFQTYRFPYPFLLLVGMAQSHGRIAESFEKVSVWFERKSNFRKHLTQKLIYPIFLLIFVVLLVFYFLLFLLPQFQKFLQDLDNDLPTSTQMLLQFQSYIQSHYLHIIIYLLIFSLIVVLLLYVFYRKKKLVSLGLKIPIVGQFIRIRFTYFFASQLGLLLDAGLGIREALIEIRKHMSSALYSQFISEIERKILLGKPLSTITKSMNIFHEEFYLLCTLGEQIGTIGAQMLLCSSLMEERIEDQVNFILKWVEPLLLLFLGGLITFVIISLFLPIIHLIQSI